MRKRENIGSLIRSVWSKVSVIPGGKTLFRHVVGQLVPYSGTISADIHELRPGFARLGMKDRRGVRNHLGSVHAIALANFCELCSGIGLLYSLPDDMRGILKSFHIDYHKKARGYLVAISEFDIPTEKITQDLIVTVKIFDNDRQLVAEAKAGWRIGPLKDTP